jgi:hypothetical protein
LFRSTAAATVRIVVIWLLIVLNIPVYLVLGWLVFDTKKDAAATFTETILAVLKIIFIPRFVRVLFDMDDSGALGLFPIGAFVFACGMLVWGEYWLVQKCLGG